MGFSDSVAGCVAQCTGLTVRGAGWGWGFGVFQIIYYCSAVLRLARQAVLPFPRLWVELPWSLHAQLPLSDGSWARGLWCLLLPVCSQE